MRHILFAQAMLPEYAAYFRGLDDDGLDALADSFSLGVRACGATGCATSSPSATYAMS